MTNERTPAFLLANLGSEVSRLTRALSYGELQLSEGALSRARAILDTLESLPLRFPERKEIVLLREVIEDLPKDNRCFSVSEESLMSYFYPFARKVLGV